MNKLSKKYRTSLLIASGIGVIGTIHLRRKFKRENNDENESSTWCDTSVSLLQTVPTRMLSRAWGNVNELTVPTWMREPFFGFYASAFKCDMAEAENADLKSYNNLQGVCVCFVFARVFNLS
eukprot:m.29028 g.29028  ORF g.29028 m.29028 type:complete len:122 (-) comp9532_c0_seq1:44-409(-)